MFSFSFVLRRFLISSLISLLTHFFFFYSMLFSLSVFILVQFFFLWLISSFIPLWSEKMLEIICILENYLKKMVSYNFLLVLLNHEFECFFCNTTK